MLDTLLLLNTIKLIIKMNNLKYFNQKTAFGMNEWKLSN